MDALVIGAGLAGTSVAHSLASRGLSVTVIDKHEQPASETSGNPAGIYMPVLEAAASPREAFYLDALDLLLNKLEKAGNAIEHDECGVLHLPRDEKIALRFDRVRQRSDLPENTFQFLNADEASAQSGLEIQQACLYYPKGGWLSPASLCHYNLDHPNITFIGNTEIGQLEHDGALWQVLSNQGDIVTQASIAVIASGHLAGSFSQSQWLPLKQVAGQISRLRTPSPHLLRQVICHKGYVIPEAEDQLLIGATYQREREGYAPHDDEHEENLRTLRRYIPEISENLDLGHVLDGRVGFRCVVPGRMPVAGLLEGPDEQTSQLAISTAHASRGILSAGLCAEIIADQLCGLSPKYSHHQSTVRPSRFPANKGA